jgi:hypothetical protein
MFNQSSTGSNTNILQLVQTYLDRLFTGTANETRAGKVGALDPIVFTQDVATNAAVNSSVQGGGGYFQTTTNDVPTPEQAQVNAPNAKVSLVVNFLQNLPISRTFMADQQLSSVAKQVKEEAKNWSATRDRNAVSTYYNGFSTQNTIDGVNLFSNSHTNAIGQTVDNLETGALNDDNLNTLVTSLRTQPSQSGVTTGYNPDFLFCSALLHRTANAVAKSVLRAGTGNNDVNYWSDLYPEMKVCYSPFFDTSNVSNATTMYVVGAKDHGVMRFDREGFSSTLVDWQYNANDQYMYKMRSREVVDSIYYNGLVGSTGAA